MSETTKHKKTIELRATQGTVDTFAALEADGIFKVTPPPIDESTLTQVQQWKLKQLMLWYQSAVKLATNNLNASFNAIPKILKAIEEIGNSNQNTVDDDDLSDMSDEELERLAKA